MVILKFSMESLAPLYKHAKESKEHWPTVAQRQDRNFLQPGKFFNEGGYADDEAMDLTKLPGEFRLVKGQGILMISSGQPRLMDFQAAMTRGINQELVVYAETFDPESEGLFGRCCAAVGGDDFVMSIPLEWYDQAIANQETWLRIKVTDQQFEVVTAPRFHVTKAVYNAVHPKMPGWLAGFFLHHRDYPERKAVFFSLAQTSRLLSEFVLSPSTADWIREQVQNPQPKEAVKKPRKRK